MATAELTTAIQPRLPKGEFRNEPFTDFTRDDVAREMRNQLVRVGDQLGHEYDLVIGGHRLRTAGKIKSINPAKPSQVVGVHQKADASHAEQTLQAALTAFESWKNAPVEERASLLLRAAEIIRQRHLEFCA